MKISSKAWRRTRGHLRNTVKNRGAGIVMNVNTGEILAMAVEPSYDLNDPFTITDPVILEELAAITDEEERAQAQTNALWQRVWRNKAVSDTYYPGSVFKMITAAAALDSGAVDTSQTFNCTGALEGGQRRHHALRRVERPRHTGFLRP